MEKDWTATAAKSRRAWSLKDLEPRFEARHADGDLIQLLESSVPPADVSRVAIFAQPLAKFSEWSQAIWELQRGFLLGEDDCQKWDVRGLSLYHDNDSYMENHRDLLLGRAMSQWWDKSDQAGPAARAAQPFGEDMPELECLTVSTDGEIKTFIKSS
eukprot:s1729_g2.t1